MVIKIKVGCVYYGCQCGQWVMEAACTQQEVGYANVESKYMERKNKKKGQLRRLEKGHGSGKQLSFGLLCWRPEQEGSEPISYFNIFQQLRDGSIDL